MKLTDKIKLGMTWLTLLALGCAQGSTIDKYKYPSLLIDNVVYSELIDYDKDGFPDIEVISYHADKGSVINFVAGYRITDIIMDGSSVVDYKRQKYPLAITHQDKNGEIYLMQYDTDENGTIDRYKDIKLNKVIGKKSQ